MHMRLTISVAQRFEVLNSIAGSLEIIFLDWFRSKCSGIVAQNNFRCSGSQHTGTLRPRNWWDCLPHLFIIVYYLPGNHRLSA